MINQGKVKEVTAEFVTALDGADAVLYVALGKPSQGPVNCNTGGYKEGNTITVEEMARGIGTLLGELILQMKMAMGGRAKEVTNDQLLSAISPSLMNGARDRMGVHMSGGGSATN